MLMRLSRQSRHRASRRAFTLLEVLIVMTIILVLIGLFFGASRALQGSAQQRLTEARLQALNGMLAELQAQGQNQFQINNWFNPQQGQLYAYDLDATLFGNMSSDLQGAISPTLTGLPTYNLQVGTSSPPSKIQYGRQVALMYMTIVPQPSPPTTANLGMGSQGTVPGNPIPPPPPATNGIMAILMALPNNQKALSNLGSSAVVNGPGGPVVVDAWGNPILFCPGSIVISGVNVVNGAAKPVGGLNNVGVGIKGDTATSQVRITSPDGRPFFVSAGPDGDFAKGDDNIYSFNVH